MSESAEWHPNVHRVVDAARALGLEIEPRNFGNPFDQGIRMNATLLDKRTGALVYATEEISNNMPPRIEPLPDRNRIVANFHEWQLQLTFTDAESPKP